MSFIGRVQLGSSQTLYRIELYSGTKRDVHEEMKHQQRQSPTPWLHLNVDLWILRICSGEVDR